MPDECCTLTDAQAIAVLALGEKRESLIASTNKQIANLNAALEELAQLVARSNGLPEHRYGFERRGNRLVLVALETPAEEKAADTPSSYP